MQIGKVASVHVQPVHSGEATSSSSISLSRRPALFTSRRSCYSADYLGHVAVALVAMVVVVVAAMVEVG